MKGLSLNQDENNYEPPHGDPEAGIELTEQVKPTSGCCLSQMKQTWNSSTLSTLGSPHCIFKT